MSRTILERRQEGAHDIKTISLMPWKMFLARARPTGFTGLRFSSRTVDIRLTIWLMVDLGRGRGTLVGSMASGSGEESGEFVSSASVNRDCLRLKLKAFV